MVEGPKVKLKCARLQSLVGQTIDRIDSSTKLKASTYPASIQKIFFVGKELFFLLSNACALRLHFGMSGYERLLSPGEDVNSTLPGHRTHSPSFTIFLNGTTAYFFGTTISSRFMMDVEISLSRKQRDIMAEELAVDEIISLLKSDDRPVFESVMDQTILPGVGNVIKCEGLFVSRIHPNAISKQIDHQRLRKLVGDLRSFSWEWYRCSLKGKDVKKLVYGKPTCECGSKVILMRSGNYERITYYCENCQALDQSYASATVVSYRRGTIGSWIEGSKRILDSWSCEACTYRNPSGHSTCEICSTRHTTDNQMPLKQCSNNIASDFKQSTSGAIEKECYTLFTDVNCKCGKRASVARVRNDGANKNRLYHACSGSVYECGSTSRRKCNYFAWADTMFPNCHHGRLATLRRVLKPGANNGRYFFCCNEEKMKSCDYFVFLEDATTFTRPNNLLNTKENDFSLKRKRLHFVMDSSVKLPL